MAKHLNGSSWFSVGWIQQRTAAYIRWESGFATFHIVSDTSPEVGVGLIQILPGCYSFPVLNSGLLFGHN